jgi:hypothetical protein
MCVTKNVHTNKCILTEMAPIDASGTTGAGPGVCLVKLIREAKRLANSSLSVAVLLGLFAAAVAPLLP